MHFRRERRNGVVVSLQETLEAGKEDSALTLSDVLQDGFCMEDACERQDEAMAVKSATLKALSGVRISTP